MNVDSPVQKILILTANPKKTDRLRLDKEVRDIQEGLRQAKERDYFIIESVWAVRSRDIRRAIFNSKPQIIHFSGHGSEDGGLALENDIGQVQLLQPEALAGLFKLLAEEINCVLLNACYSEIQADAIVQHINFVIGMSREIGDRAAIEFSVGFYDALGAGYSVDRAYDFGCNAIQMAGITEHLTPVIKRKSNLPLAHSTSTPSFESLQLEDSVTRSVKLESPSKVVYAFVLSGSVNEVNEQKLKAIFAHIKELSEDTSLTLRDVESGSIRLILEGSPEGFEKLKSLVESGELTEILDISIQDIQLEEEAVLLAYSDVEQHLQEVARTNEEKPSDLSDSKNSGGNITVYIAEEEAAAPSFLLTRQNFLKVIGAGIIGALIEIIVVSTSLISKSIGGIIAVIEEDIGIILAGKSETILFAETSTADVVASLAVRKELRSLIAVATAVKATDYIIPDPENPLRGTYTNVLTFTTKNPETNEKRTYTIDRPKFIRKSQESSLWELDPDVKELVLQILDIHPKFGEG